jgi:hypothetical protein
VVYGTSKSNWGYSVSVVRVVVGAASIHKEDEVS